MSSGESNIPKATLYYNPESAWSAVVLLGLYEKGYGTDEVDLRVVDVASGENYSPTFLRLNPKATVPTLVVPLQKTLSEDVESRYKAITDSKAIVEFLDKSRSARSGTKTTSDAPAPMLTPATIALLEKSNEIIELVHSSGADPNNLWYFCADDEESLRKHAAEALPILYGKTQALRKFLGEAESDKVHVSEKTKQFWMEKQASVQAMLDVYSVADKAAGELGETELAKRRAYFAAAKSGWADVKGVVERLDKAVIGPYALGDQFSIADLHLAAWLGRIARLAQGAAGGDGATVGRQIWGGGGEEGPGQVGRYWVRVRERESWKKVY